MSDKQNITELCDMLADILDIKRSKDQSDIDILSAAIEKLNKNKDLKSVGEKLDKDVNQKLSEEVGELYVSNITPPFWDYVRMKYLGFPDVKSWAQLDKINKQILSNVDEDIDVPDDEDHDSENGISWEDIDKFLSTLTVDDYLRIVYDDDELAVPENDDDENEIINDPLYKEFDCYTTKQLLDQIEQCDKNKYEDPDSLVEALTMAQRMKRAIKMRARAAQIAIKRKIAMQKHATPEKLVQRARRLAIRMLKSRLAGGKKIIDLSYADRERIEKMIDKRKNYVDMLTRKMLPVVRRIEKERFTNTKHVPVTKQYTA